MEASLGKQVNMISNLNPDALCDFCFVSQFVCVHKYPKCYLVKGKL